ncbi:MAG: mechanosensitive ion channel family protein [Planctomycetota bacterium]|nr:mechanosensitive ion channel family protein [Planctomycetota bacterium]
MDALADMLRPYVENPWIQSLGIFILSLVLTVVARWSLRFVLLGLAEKTKTEVDDILIRAVKKVVTYSLPVIGLMVALTPLALQTTVPHRILFSLLAVLLMGGAIGLLDDMSKWLERNWVKRTASTLDEDLLPLLRKAVKTSVAIVGLLIILGKWEVEIAPLLGALGIGGLAIALALNSTLSNVFSGIQLILDRSVNVGDKVQLESGEVGVLLDIGLRTTMMRTYDNEVISLPNSQLANARVKNYTKHDATIRSTVNFAVAYGSDVAQVKRVVLDAISELDDILQEPGPQVLFLNMGDFALDMSARVWVDDYGKQFARKLEMMELVYNTLNKNDIEIPFPTRTVHMKQ